MGSGGRPRKPLALHLVTGTARKDRINPASPRGEALKRIPPPPADLNEHERAAWKTLAKLIQPMNVLTRADLVAFRQMAVMLGIVEQARAEIREAGGALFYVVHTDSGTVYRKRPQVEIIATFQRQLAAALGHFGLTPSDREKVSELAGDEGEDDPLDEFTS